ncbi:MAG: YerC/YecD family TrpR-related protein [Patescibacteria group bacterium]|nr:YerC/YecD family TrpR-related protein [Patescibacteria group bacterium]
MKWNTSEKDRLVRAILALETRDEARRFLRDLLTTEEIAEFARRFRAAEMLSERIPYTSIVRQTGLSSTTVARVSKWLKGREGGYRLAIARLHGHPIPVARGG